MHPAAVLYDALFYASKSCPRRVSGKWPLGAVVAPAGARAAIANVAPSIAATILEFTADEGFRLHLPPPTAVTAPSAIAAAWKTALLACTPAGAAGLQIPISPVEHENEQLRWGREGVPLCVFGEDCDGAKLAGAPGPLGAYLSVAEADIVAGGGPVPQGALFCLLCIRRDCQAMYLAHRAALGGTVDGDGRPTFCVPPFQNLVDVPGGYVAASIAVPAAAAGCMPIRVVGVAANLRVVTDAMTGDRYVDQAAIVHGVLNGRAAVA